MQIEKSIKQSHRVVRVGAALLLAAALTALGAAYFGLSSYQRILSEQVSLERSVKDLNYLFKLQVQEWKNVLLRGHNSADFLRYWSQFEIAETAALELTDDIREQSDNRQFLLTLEHFVQEHRALGEQYRSAKSIYLGGADFDPMSADTSVRGVDRAPSNLLVRLANLVGEGASSAAEELQVQSRWIISLAASALILTFLVVAGGVSGLVRNSVETEIRSRTKSDFLAKMSHEIRTPMNGVLGMTELLSSTELNATQRRYNDAVLSSGNALVSIINDLLDYSKIEAGKFELDSEPFDIRQLVEDVYFVFSYTAKKKAVGLLFDVDKAVPQKILGDSSRLRQVLLNLLSNAVKFTDQGEVNLRVSLRRGQEGELKLNIEVSDTGIGMSNEVSRGVFEPFSQADGSINRRFGGTGLGLAIAREIVRHMGGDVFLESEEGKGSQFNILVPMKVAVDAAPKEAGLLDGKRLLLVDDAVTYAEIYQRWAEHWGMKVKCFVRSSEVIPHLESGAHYDLICADFNMPGLNGLNLSGQIRNVAGNAQTPILLLTATGDLPDPLILKDHGINHAQEKPALPERLKPLFEGLIEGRNLIDESRVKKVQHNNLAMNVLVADDNAVNCMVVKGMLLQLGHTVTQVEDGQQALEAYQHAAKPFDLIVMDCEMPIMDGFVATQKIRSLERSDSQRRRIKIYALTAHAGDAEKEKAISAGMDVVLTKPVSQAALREALNVEI